VLAPIGLLTSAENPDRRLWFIRDHLAMAQKLDLDIASFGDSTAAMDLNSAPAVVTTDKA